MLQEIIKSPKHKAEGAFLCVLCSVKICADGTDRKINSNLRAQGIN